VLAAPAVFVAAPFLFVVAPFLLLSFRSAAEESAVFSK
jgi:hypothetical protein